MCYFRLLFLLFCSPQASYRQIEKTITTKTQQAETQIVCRQVFAQQKSAETKRRFAKIKRHFSTIKRRFVGTKRRFGQMKRRFIFAKRRFVLQGFRQGTTKLQTLLFSVCCNLTEIGFVIWQNERARD